MCPSLKRRVLCVTVVFVEVHFIRNDVEPQRSRQVYDEHNVNAPNFTNFQKQPSNFTTMEVHHHAHTAMKRWTHYFWEFLMLFLAVFAGFMAENQREHYVEHLREKQFTRSLVN